MTTLIFLKFNLSSVKIKKKGWSSINQVNSLVFCYLSSSYFLMTSNMFDNSLIETCKMIIFYFYTLDHNYIEPAPKVKNKEQPFFNILFLLKHN